jgi:hypothetical protein
MEHWIKCGVPNQLGKDELLASICRGEEDNNGNRCDYVLSFVFDADPGCPEYDFWLRGDQVVSWQPVF